MAYAIVNERKHRVRVTKDLGDNYAVEVFNEPDKSTIKVAEPFKGWPVPLCMKVLADTPEDALACALEHLKKLKKISDYHLEEHEKPKPPAPKAPAAAAKSDDAEE
jgi:hypothetical protein